MVARCNGKVLTIVFSTLLLGRAIAGLSKGPSGFALPTTQPYPRRHQGIAELNCLLPLPIYIFELRES
ncbi:unnamed protein product [Pieris brassicae]|uniref:Secreted protein n=1 Tax=Pieris brassicae TaxID=7116 RepID=A0A9P0SJT2_PIEBR|nr:unnamed protein product [Pieris brassicae]